MISLPGRTVGALTALGLTLACQHVATPRSATVLGKGSGASAVELRAAADRPAVSLVHREGDPTGAVALALALLLVRPQGLFGEKIIDRV